MSRYLSCRLGLEGFCAEALGASWRVRASLWRRDWKLSVPLVFLSHDVRWNGSERVWFLFLI